MMKDYEILIIIIYCFTTLNLDSPFIPPFTVNTKRRKTPLVNIYNSSIVMMFFLISVDCVTLLKRLSQLAFSDRIKHPDISKNALWLLTPKPLPQISKQASPHNLIKDCSTSAS